MTTYAWTVELNSSEVDDVQSISISTGRRQTTDNFKAGTATITGRVNNDARWIAGTVLIGDPVYIYADDGVVTSPHPVFYGIVSDLQINYGINDQEDTWQLIVEDTLAQVGRAVTSSSFALTGGDTTWEAIEDLSTDIGIGVTKDGDPSPSTVSAQSLGNQNALAVLNQIVATEHGQIYGAGGPDTFIFQTRYQFPPDPAMVFTDGSTAAGPGELTSAFDKIIFRSQADSFFDRVVVEPAGLVAQSSGTGDRAYTLSSFDQTTTQAANLADYVLSQLDVDQDVPQEISVQAESTSFDVASLTTYNVQPYLQPVSVILRGTRYECQVIGVNITATPASSRWTFYLVSSLSFSPFILDSSTLGVLDVSRLGF